MMAQQITITSYTGSTPVDVYVADTYGNNRAYVGQINSSVPPSVTFSLPTGYTTVPMVSIVMVETNGCESTEKYDCQG